MVKLTPRSVVGQMVLDYVRSGVRFSLVASRMCVTESYVRYVDHKYNWESNDDQADHAVAAESPGRDQ